MGSRKKGNSPKTQNQILLNRLADLFDAIDTFEELEARIKRIEDWITQWETYDSGWMDSQRKENQQ